MTRHAPARLGAAGLALAAAFGLGTLGVPPAPVAVAANQNVRIVDGPTPNYYGYDPDPTNINAGDTVTWANQGLLQHTVTFESASLDSGLIAPGQSWNNRFTTPGSYNYFCTV